ncbi:hypothetical protein SAMN04488127_2345 [Bhargavaea ginsengi]|uniref:DUF2304 domain-containing protein n=1 Tax=Bhargavaea ginsengi TaxID=426757 RepID=A0A1H7AC67_9BACL|nr:DUF2304 domain-containing protein [Bhargavaea ginsengi]SEJ62988.1 hypothetical protein SAMN04488127_2345 [Bhargavaea ginsengi]
MEVTYFSFILVVILFIVVIESVRRGILETKYSLLWIIVCLFMGFFSISERFINKLGEFLGVFYPPSLLFLFGLLFIIVLVFDLTRRISKLNKALTNLTQEYAIMKKKFEEKDTD